MEKNIDLTQIKVQVAEDIKPEIQLTPQISIKMKYPEFGVVKDSLKFEDIN